MGDYLKKKKVQDALKKAKELEKEKLLTPKEEVDIQKEAVSFSEKLRRLLAPAWFVSDVHKNAPVKAAKTTVRKKKSKKKKQVRTAGKKKKK